MKKTNLIHPTLAALVLTLGCSEPDATTAPTEEPSEAAAETSLHRNRPGREHREAVLQVVETWNDRIDEFVRLARMSPPIEARAMAMSTTVVHDILNAVWRRFEPYAFDGRAERPLSVEAAVATAVFEVLAPIGAGLTRPDAGAYLAAQHESYMAALGESDDVARGKELGHAAAEAMLAARAGDGSAQPVIVVFTSTGEPGKFRSPVASATALTGPQGLPGWGAVRPFVLASGSQFRSPPMYGAATVEDAVQTAAYRADYEEVRRLGGMVSERTQDQTDIGLFWIESTNRGWNRIARTLGSTGHLDAWRLARLLAHVALAQTDAYIGTFDTKYTYNFWRPVTAIRLGNLDASTPGDPAWQVASMLVPELGATPPIPDYNSAHAMAGGAAAVAIQANIHGTTAFTMESSTLPGKPRSFESVAEAAKENADSRVYVGFHFRQATVEGLRQGRRVGRYVVMHALQPARGR